MGEIKNKKCQWFVFMFFFVFENNGNFFSFFILFIFFFSPHFYFFFGQKKNKKIGLALFDIIGDGLFIWDQHHQNISFYGLFGATNAAGEELKILWKLSAGCLALSMVCNLGILSVLFWKERNNVNNKKKKKTPNAQAQHNNNNNNKKANVYVWYKQHRVCVALVCLLGLTNVEALTLLWSYAFHREMFSMPIPKNHEWVVTFGLVQNFVNDIPQLVLQLVLKKRLLEKKK